MKWRDKWTLAKLGIEGEGGLRAATYSSCYIGERREELEAVGVPFSWCGIPGNEMIDGVLRHRHPLIVTGIEFTGAVARKDWPAAEAAADRIDEWIEQRRTERKAHEPEPVPVGARR